FFFFQAEDGIRVFHVTGVQTCALPISAAAHIRPDLFVAMDRAARAQQLEPARRLFHALAPVIRLVFAEPNPGPLKAWLARQGLLSDVLRAPMPRASAALAEQLAMAVAALDRQFPAQALAA